MQGKITVVFFFRKGVYQLVIREVICKIVFDAVQNNFVLKARVAFELFV